MSKLLRIFLVAPLVLAAMPGCEAIKDTAEAPAKLRSMARQTRKSLNRLQQRGLIDLEVQQTFKAIHGTYSAYSRQHGSPPRQWSDLTSLARSTLVDPVLLRNGKTNGFTVIWGIDLSAVATDQPIVLAHVANAPTRGIAVLWSDGEMEAVTTEELQSLLEGTAPDR